MSGKAPPRAPRALLHSFPTTVAPSSATTSTSTASSRIGAPPPTGPRSLISGVNGHYGQAGSRGIGRGKPYVNGHSTIPTGPAASTPTGPRSALKGKQVDQHFNQASSSIASDPSSSPSSDVERARLYTQLPQTNGAGPSKVNGELTNNRKQPVSFRLRPPPPQPTTEPPPPPPPTTEPPPPPPPSTTPPPPPPPPLEPPPPPSSEPPPPPSPPPPHESPPPVEPSPRTPSPPPPPPLTSAPPPPPPPLVAPPRLPPTAPRNHAVPQPLSRPPPGPRTHSSSSVPPPPPPRSPSPPPPAKPKLYTLPPPPPWPPARTEYPPGKNYKVLFDYLVDRDRDGQMRMLADKLRDLGLDQGEEARVKGKGKGKEVVIRYDGDVIDGEHPAVLRDPRKEAKVKRKEILRVVQPELESIKYEYDEHSTGPPLPTAVLALNLSPLTPNQHIRRCFSVHGTITSFEPQIDKSTGAALGIVFIKYSSHAEARKCVKKEHGKRLTALNGVAGGGDEMVVVLDGEGKKLRAVLKVMEAQKRRALEEKRRQEKEKSRETRETSAARGTPSTTTGQTPAGSSHTSRQPVPWQKSGGMLPPPASAKLPPKPVVLLSTVSDLPGPSNTHLSGVPNGSKGSPPTHVRKAPPSTFRARLLSVSKHGTAQSPSLRPPLPATESSSSTPSRPWSHRWRADDRNGRSRSPSRSPSPGLRRPGQSSRNAYQRDHEAVVEALARNGFEHVTLDGHGGQLGSAVREEDVRQFFQGFRVDKILRDRLGWYVTFETSDSARRAAMVLGHGSRTLAYRSVNVTVHPAPAAPSAPAKKRWTDGHLVDEATSIITKELRALLGKDLVDKVVSASVQKLVTEERGKRLAKAADGDQEGGEAKWSVSLRGLSFRKQRKRPREEETKVPGPPTAPAEPEHQGAEMQAEILESEPVVERPMKRQRKTLPKKVVNEDIESEDEEVHDIVTVSVENTEAFVDEDAESEDEDPSLPVTLAIPDVLRKRSTSEVTDIEEPVKKRPKVQPELDNADKIVAPLPKKTKKPSKKAIKKAQLTTAVEEVIHQVLPDDLDFDIPEVTQVRLTPTPHYDSSLSPLASPIRRTKKLLPTSTRSPALPDPFAEGICGDDEDLYFVKLALARNLDLNEPDLQSSGPTAPDTDAPTPFRVHVTGSARTEGYYKISHAEKSAYVAQYASRSTVSEEAAEVEQPAQSVISSRSNRANARRRAQGLEEINQVQRAMALSKGESAATELIKFNQLQSRKKHLRFARSPIHDWGLYAMEKISRGEMVIEYVGEIIRAQVADKREKAYERQGIGSSYLFRIDEDLVVDATKKGNLGRLINHSCEPNCTARIITINGEKKIVIYAKQDIELGSEITYDYHFPIEQDKIPCLCGSAKCRGFLN